MLIYLIKFSACLAIFMVFYKLLLEKESMHQLKRYYLLAAIVIALAIPFVTFTTYVEPQISTFTEFQSLPVNYIQTEFVEAPIDYTPIILWSLYGLGVLLFSIKFILNLSKIIVKIRRNQKHTTPHFTYVLLRDLITPHTFFSHIFLNKQNFESQQIPMEVFIHEEAHSKQKHSIDVLLIELLQIAFWFNPLIYFLKHAIKMNHEFLADAAVLKQGISPSIYQQLLLAFSSNASEPQLANAINYSSIKKRFTVMKTHTSKQKIWLRSFLLLPLVVLTLYGFSERKEVFKENSFSKQNEIKLTISKNNDMVLNNSTSVNFDTFRTKLSQIVEELSPAELETTLMRIESEGTLNTKVVKPIIIDIFNSGIKNIELNAENVELYKDDDLKKMFENSTLNFNVSGSVKYMDVNQATNNIIEKNKPLLQLSNIVKAVCDNCTLDKKLLENASIVTSNNDEVENFKVKFPSHASLYIEGNKINNDVLKLLESLRPKEAFLIYDIKTKNELIDGYMSVNIKTTEEGNGKNVKVIKGGDWSDVEYYLKEGRQEKATPEEVAEYNKLAKHSNSELSNEHPIIKVNEVERIKYLFGKMSKDQKKNAEAYPDFSKMPPPPLPEDGFIDVNGETLYYIKFNPIKYYNRKGYLVDKNGNTLNGNIQVNASDVLPGHYITKVYKNDIVVAEFKDNGSQNIPSPPPPPPAPKSPLEHIKEMSTKGATFFYEGTSISSDEAIKLLKKNDELNIQTKQSDSKNPKVYISKSPIIIKK